MTRAALAICALAVTSLEAAAPARPSFETSVVGLSVTYQTYDPDRPWTKKAPEVRFPLATVVEGGFLLTTAEAVGDATLVEVDKLGRATRVPARVVRADYDVNLALLAVDAPGFFDDLTPVVMAQGIPTSGSVLSVRWKNRRIEVSASRVSRIEVQSSLVGTVDHPFLLVTTDLRGGGWSEPVFSDGAFVGLTVSQNEQTARVLPVDLIASFLEMAHAPGAYPGFAGWGTRWQLDEDPALAAFLGLPGEPRGVVINYTPWGDSGCGVLRPRDILLSLDGHEIDASGLYQHPRYGLLRYTGIPSDGHRAGDVIPAEVWRDGKLVKLEIRLARASSENALVPDSRPGLAPAYLVAGGLVFRELDGAYLRSWGDDWRKKAPIQFLVARSLFFDQQQPSRRRIVVLSAILPSAYNVGYHDLGDVEVREINGRPVDSISEVEEAFRHPERGFHRIVLRGSAARSEIILDAESFERATAETLEHYRIPERIRREPPRPDLGPSCEQILAGGGLEGPTAAARLRQAASQVPAPPSTSRAARPRARRSARP